MHPAVCENYDVDSQVYTAEIDLDALYALAKTDKTYKKLPKFPSTQRDLALIADNTVLAAQIESVVKKQAGNLLEALKLFDVYKGKQVPEGKKSMAYTIVFRAEEKTLTDEDVNPVVDKILKALSEQLGVTLR